MRIKIKFGQQIVVLILQIPKLICGWNVRTGERTATRTAFTLIYSLKERFLRTDFCLRQDVPWAEFTALHIRAEIHLRFSLLWGFPTKLWYAFLVSPKNTSALSDLHLIVITTNYETYARILILLRSRYFPQYFLFKCPVPLSYNIAITQVSHPHVTRGRMASSHWEGKATWEGRCSLHRNHCTWGWERRSGPTACLNTLRTRITV